MMGWKYQFIRTLDYYIGYVNECKRENKYPIPFSIWLKAHNMKDPLVEYITGIERHPYDPEKYGEIVIAIQVLKELKKLVIDQKTKGLSLIHI